MSNKLETSYHSLLLKNKINKLVEDLNKILSNENLSSQEDIVSSYYNHYKELLKMVDQPIFNPKKIKEGELPSLSILNFDFNAISEDLSILYSHLDTIKDLLLAQFNSINLVSEDLKTSLAELSSDIQDYRLQNSYQNNIQFGDFFYNFNKIETENSFYSKEKVFPDFLNRRISLPLDGEAEELEIHSISIVEDSIGRSGNNQELFSSARDSLSYLYDSSLDTWFEFEQVSPYNILTPTVLNLKVELKEEGIFNILQIESIKMPNGSSPKIVELLGSLDGSFYFNVMNSFLGNTTEENGGAVISLSEDLNSDIDGQKYLYFSPRRIKFLKIKLSDNESFQIRTPTGTRNRIAIGIKEISIKAQKFKQEGQLISAPFSLDKEISKISLFSNEYHPEGYQSNFDFFISTDEGKSWKEIGASQKINQEKPEILNFNLDFLEDSISTELPVNSFRVKADISIEESGSETSKTSGFNRVHKTEFLSLPSSSKQVLLEEKPIGSVNIYETNLGSVGGDSFYRVRPSDIIELEDRIIVRLPSDLYFENSIKVDQENVYINNYTWKRVNDLTAESPSSYCYEFDYVNNIITFYKSFLSGTDLIRGGAKPSSLILFSLKRESALFQKESEDSYSLDLKFHHDGIKEKISLYALSEEDSSIEIVLRPNTRIHRTGKTELSSIEIAEDNNGKFTNLKDYIDGVTELVTLGDYSIDKKRGVIYSYSEVLDSDLVRILVKFKDRKDIEFDILESSIIVKESNYPKSFKTFDLSITDSFQANLGHKNITKRTILFNQIPSGLLEVPFESMEIYFNNPEDTKNYYAVDYRNGIVYFKNRLTGKISGSLENSFAYVEYNLSRKIPASSYTLDLKNQKIVFTDSYIFDEYSEEQSFGKYNSIFKLDYFFAQDIEESSSELLQFISPFLNSYEVIITDRDMII